MEDSNIVLKDYPNSCFKEISEFFSRNFDGEYKKLKKLFDFILEKIPSSHFYAITKNNNILGALVLVKRIIYFNGISVDCCGLSFMAKEKRISNNFVVNKLIKKVLEESSKHQVSMGFASKKMDNFWYRYGFIGIDNFVELVIPIKKFQILENNKSQILKLTKDKIEGIQSIYNKTYSKSFLSFNRSKEEWHYCFVKNKTQYEFKLITIKDKIVAYIVYYKNQIIELSFDCNLQILKKIIFNYFFDLGFNEINFKLSLDHPFMNFLEKYDYSIYYRSVLKGGHIFRINQIKNFCKKIRKKLESELIRLNIRQYLFCFKGANFRFNDNTLIIDFDKGFEENDIIRREFALLFFGYQRLDGIDKLLFNSKRIRLSNLDHF